MKYITIILAQLICSITYSQDTKNPLTGSWYWCDEKGYYKEAHFMESSFATALGDDAGQIGAPLNFYFQMTSDSSFIYSDIPPHMAEKENIVTVYFRFENERLLTNLRSEDEKVLRSTLRRLPIKFVDMPYGSKRDQAEAWYDNFEKEFNKRVIDYGCNW